MKRNKAFTLIELLVVVAIIAVLISILLPALSSARNLAREAVDMSNQRQIGVGINGYINDFNGYVCAPSYTALNQYYRYSHAFGYWNSMLYAKKYVPDQNAFFCPDWVPHNYRELETMGLKWIDHPTALNVLPGVYRAYGYRVWVEPGAALNDSVKGQWAPHRLSMISDPSDFFLLSDSISLVPDMSYMQQGYILTPNFSLWRIHTRHRNKANTLFADGHVQPKEAGYFLSLHLRQGEYSQNGAFYVWPE